MLRGRRGRETEQVLELADAQLAPLRQRTEDADAVLVGEGVGDSEQGAHGYLRRFAIKRNIESGAAQPRFSRHHSLFCHCEAMPPQAHMPPGGLHPCRFVAPRCRSCS